MWLEICAGLLVLACIVIIVYLLAFSKPLTIKKKTEGSTVQVIVKAKRDIPSIELSAGKNISFVRKNIKKGQEVEFSFPSSETPAKMLVELGKGKTKEYEL